MLLAALLTIAGILAGLVFLFSDRAQQLHPAAPTVIPLWKLYSYIKEAKKRSIGFMELMRERFGGIIAIKVPFWRHIAILTGPQYAKSFFFSKEADINEGYQLFHKLVSPDAVRHNPQMVDVFKKAFSKDRLAHLQKDLQAEIQKYLVSHWSKDEQTIDLFAEIEKLSLIIFIKSFAGSDLASSDIDRIIYLMKNLDVEEKLRSMDKLIPNMLPSGKQHSAKYWDEFEALIQRQADKRIYENSQTVDFMNYLIKELRVANGMPDYRQIALCVFFIIFAGTTNTHATSAWSLVYLSLFPEQRAKLMEEKEKYFEKLASGINPVDDLISSSSFSSRFVNETVRTSANGIALRVAANDMKLDENVTIPKGWYIVLLSGLLMNNSEIFSNPEKFDPQRYETEGKKPCEMISFGSGRHPCTGAHYAYMNIKTLLYNVLQQFDIEPLVPLKEILPKDQVFGVFRPTKTCLVKLRRNPNAKRAWITDETTFARKETVSTG